RGRPPADRAPRLQPRPRPDRRWLAAAAPGAVAERAGPRAARRRRARSPGHRRRARAAAGPRTGVEVGAGGDQRCEVANSIFIAATWQIAAAALDAVLHTCPG